MEKISYKNVDEYIGNFPPETQIIMNQIRETIKKAAPLAEEIISYNMPAYSFKGILVYFAAYKQHIGFYPTGLGIAAFKDEITEFKSSKGAIQFPLNKPIPFDLIIRIVEYRLSQNLNKAALKTKKL